MTLDDLKNRKQSIIDSKCSLNNVLDKMLYEVEMEIRKLENERSK